MGLSSLKADFADQPVMSSTVPMLSVRGPSVESPGSNVCLRRFAPDVNHEKNEAQCQVEAGYVCEQMLHRHLPFIERQFDGSIIEQMCQYQWWIALMIFAIDSTLIIV